VIVQVTDAERALVSASRQPWKQFDRVTVSCPLRDVSKTK
jgi:hypothetical protein